MPRYLIRLDDACPWMDKTKWEQIETILDKYGIKPLMGIIPKNEDCQTKVDNENPFFWTLAQSCQDRGWAIALHGYNHVYATACGGINPIHNRSEFAGLEYKKQAEKIRKGYKILKENGIKPTYFFAPSHTYDKNTIKALKEETPIRLVCDTIALKPYKFDKDFVIVPCQMGEFRKIPLTGYWTISFHPNSMDDIAFAKFESFIARNRDKFIPFHELPIEKARNKTTTDRLLSFIYFTMRKLIK